MKLFGWLRAWLCTYWDFTVAGGGLACFLVYAGTLWPPFMVAAIVLSCIAVVVVFTGRERARELCLRLPVIKQWRHRRWQNHVRWIAGRQKAGLGGFCWGKALSDLPQHTRGEFLRDIQRLHEELGRPAAPDKNRKDHEQ